MLAAVILFSIEHTRTISLITHPNKVMLKVIQNGTSTTVEKFLEGQTVFRPGRSSVEQIVNCRILREKYVLYQWDL